MTSLASPAPTAPSELELGGRVDPRILKKLTASVSATTGCSNQQSFVVSVDAVVPGQRAFQDRHLSCQLVTRSFDDFCKFRKSLLSRVRSRSGLSSNILPPSLRRSTSLRANVTTSSATGKCRCQDGKSCPFESTRDVLSTLRFTRMPLFPTASTNEVIRNKRQAEIQSFLQVVFGLLRRMPPSEWQPGCLFLDDLMAFLGVEESSIFEDVERYMDPKHRRMSLDGWRSFTRDNFGNGLSAI